MPSFKEQKALSLLLFRCLATV